MTRLKRYAKYAVMALFVVFLGALAYDVTKNPVSAPEQPKMAVAAPVIEQPPTVEELLRLVNEERARVGVKPLKLDPLLNKSAQYKAQDMIDRNYFAHKAPGTDRNNGLDYAEQLGVDCVYISENISWADKGENTSESAMIGWMNSKPHREALQDSRYESTGIGISGNKIVQHFCDEN